MLATLTQTILVDNSCLDWSPIGSHSLWPDWRSLRKTNAGSKGNCYASVMCFIGEPDENDPDTDCRHCPRATLRRVLKQAQDSCGLTFLIGFEIESMLMGTSEEGKRYQLLQTSGLWTARSCRTQAFAYVEEIMDDLRSLDVAVQHFHPEGPSDQFEISLAPLPLMEAIDTLMLTYEVIKNVAFRHGHEATMYPKPFAEHPANGAHTHLSMHLSDKEETFLAGLLTYLPSLCVFTMGSPESYIRIKSLEAGEWVAWGTQSRSLPVRKVAHGHWELRSLDATTNMYLALTACIGMGLLGLRKEELKWKDFLSWASNLSDDERRKLGILTRLPTTLGTAVERLKERK